MDDFIGGNYSRQSEDQKNAKKWMKIIAVILVLLFVACIALVGVMYYIQSIQLKITVDGKATKSLENVLIFENGKVYIPIRAFAEYVGYTSSNGGYKQYSEDTTKCYVQCNNEVATFSLNSNKIYKLLLDGNNDYEYYEIAEPIRLINNQLCTTIEGAKIAFNVSMAYNQQENRVTIFTLPYLVTYYTAKFQNAGIADGNANFSNQKALLYDMLIVKDASNSYGVYDLNGKEILGIKYASIKFIESTKEFVVTTKEKKMGIMLHDSSTKISPEYDNIKQIDKDSGLYLVTNNRKLGVINEHGSTVIFIEYDQIGIDSSRFLNNHIQNQYLLYDVCIPVKINNKWRLFDKTGKRLTNIEYDDLGCTSGSGISGDRNAAGVLLIPDYEAIVVKVGEFYGIIDSTGKEMLPPVLSSVYSTTSAGEITYSMVHNNQVINVIDYIKTYIKPDAPTNNNQNNNGAGNTTNNGQTNETNNSTVTNEVNNNQTNNEVTGNTVPTGANAVENNNTVPNGTNIVENNNTVPTGANTVENSNTVPTTTNTTGGNTTV